MQTLWSPWRSKYIGTFSENPDTKDNTCFLCQAHLGTKPDSESYVVARREYCFAVLNLYPYNNGHVLVAPNRHVGDFSELKPNELSEIILLQQEVVSAIRKIYSPHGFNLGANLGLGSGAGVPEHIHFHVIPRWIGDTSFISTLSDTKVVSVAIEDTWRQLSDLL